MRALVLASLLAVLPAIAFSQTNYRRDLACESRVMQECQYNEEGKDNAARRGTGVADYCARQATEQCANKPDDDDD